MTKKIEVTEKDLDEVAKIKELEEHDPKYNIKENKLEEANKKMTQITEKNTQKQIFENTLKKRKGLTSKGNNIIRKRSTKQTKKVWEKFLKEEEANFFSLMGYGKEEIEKIGVAKFLDAMDWKFLTDVKSWRTDKLHIIPCIDCRDDFAIYEKLGLCDKCKEKYDIDHFHEVAAEAEKELPNSLSVSRDLFVFDKETRKRFIKKEGE